MDYDSALIASWSGYGVALLLAAGLFYMLRRLRFDGVTLAIVAAGVALLFFHLYMTASAGLWKIYTNDTAAHVAYVQYMARHFTPPPPFESAAFRHPPTYYMFASQVFLVGEWLGGDDGAIQAVRLFSLSFYFVFLVYALLALRVVLPRGAGYYAAVALLMFWPLGITLGGRISCDAPVLAATAALLYHLIRWQQRFDHTHLALAIAATGIGVLCKNPMLIWVPLLLAGVALGLWRRWFTRASLKRRDVYIATFLLLAATVYTVLRATMLHYVVGLIDSGTLDLSPASWFSALAFDPLHFLVYTIHQPITKHADPLFTELFLRSLYLDQFYWQSEQMVLAGGVLLLGLVLYVGVSAGWMAFSPASPRRLLLLSAGMVLLPVATLLFAFMTIANAHYANARYAYVAVIIIAFMLGLAVDWHARSGRRLLAAVGMALALAFAASSVLLIVGQHMPAFRFQVSEVQEGS